MDCSNLLSISEIVNHILAGDPVILPTETVYGIAVRYDLQHAVDKLFAMKQRDINKPISLHMSKDMLPNFMKLSSKFQNLADRLLPGPFTLIVQSDQQYGFHSKAKFNNKIGVRVPSNSVFQEIVSQIGVPLCMTSVNYSNQKSATKFADCEFNLPGIEDDANVTGEESLIIDTVSMKIHRV